MGSCFEETDPSATADGSDNAKQKACAAVTYCPIPVT
jgi:hypothetical protein